LCLQWATLCFKLKLPYLSWFGQLKVNPGRCGRCRVDLKIAFISVLAYIVHSNSWCLALSNQNTSYCAGAA
jgi:hypothetical protein